MTDQEIFEAAKDAFWTNVDKKIFAIEREKTVDITADIYAFARDILSRAIPEGHVVVPKEPTDDMGDAGYSAYRNTAYQGEWIKSIYRAMIAAAPENKEV